MVFNALAKYVFVRSSIFVLRAIAPASCVVVAYGIIKKPPSGLLSKTIFGYCVIETCFYLLVYLPIRYYVQYPAIHPKAPPKEELDLIFNKCSETITDPDHYLRRWFGDAPLDEIRLENVKEFLRWAFWGTNNPHAVPEGDLDYCVSLLENKFGREIPPGRGKAKSLRVTIDDVDIIHRPFIWYLVRSKYQLYAK
jgi:hypothetical protein